MLVGSCLVHFTVSLKSSLFSAVIVGFVEVLETWFNFVPLESIGTMCMFMSLDERYTIEAMKDPGSLGYILGIK